MICHKLPLLSITWKIIEWLHDILKGRNQAAAPNRALSKEIVIESRVPQRTVMEPLLFMVALSDMSLVTQIASLTSYANGTKVVQAVKESCHVNLQQKDLDVIYKCRQIPSPLLWTKWCSEVTKMILWTKGVVIPESHTWLWDWYGQWCLVSHAYGQDGGSVQANGWMGSDNLQKKGPGNYVGLMGDIGPQPFRLLLPIEVT